MDKIIPAIIARSKEPSTWAGTGILALLIHAKFPGALGDSIIEALQGIAGVLAIIMAEKKMS